MCIRDSPSGDAVGYLNHRTQASAYPTGTMIVKAFLPSWELFAMAKRGGGFNAKGALGWEFFRLKLVNDTPVIVSRGIFAWDPDGDGGVGYGSAGTVLDLSLIHISEPTRLLSISYAVFCLKKK